jgi:predicted Na+-dependent transporter
LALIGLISITVASGVLIAGPRKGYNRWHICQSAEVILLEILNKLGSLRLVLFVLSSMAAIGAGHSVRQVFGRLCNPWLLLAVFVANFVLLPGCAFALAFALLLEEPKTR